VLYAGLMICDGEPKVLEYNVRFGDPECEPIMMRLESSLVEMAAAAAAGRLDSVSLRWSPQPAACVVMASGGYPGDYRKGDPITGIEEAESTCDVVVFHAGTRKDEAGRWLSNGGRVLAVTARGDDIGEALRKAYAGVQCIHWDGVHFRTDIGHRALERTDD
jgi:phosphoribosylamine--glycine ligase